LIASITNSNKVKQKNNIMVPWQVARNVNTQIWPDLVNNLLTN